AFVVAYVSVRLILLALYVRVYRDLEVARPVARWFIMMFGVAVCVWLISLAVPVPWKYAFWGIALLLEHIGPIRACRLVRGVAVAAGDAGGAEGHRGGVRPVDPHRPRRVGHRRRPGNRARRLDRALGHGRVRGLRHRGRDLVALLRLPRRRRRRDAQRAQR